MAYRSILVRIASASERTALVVGTVAILALAGTAWGVSDAPGKLGHTRLHSPVRASTHGQASFHRHLHGHRTAKFLHLGISGLPAPGRGYVYGVWLSPKADRGYPLAPLVPFPRDGRYADDFIIPSTAKRIVRQARFVQVELSSVKKLRSGIRAAIRGRDRDLLLPRIGRTVLQGRLSG